MATTAAAVLLIWAALAVAACLAMHRARQAAPPPPQPPDGEDWPTVEFPALPPVPGPASDTAPEFVTYIPSWELYPVPPSVTEMDREWLSMVGIDPTGIAA